MPGRARRQTSSALRGRRWLIPDWFRKVVAGHGSQVRLCLYTNYCEALDQRHRQVTCELWDREALDEPGVKLSSDGKRRLTPPAWRP